MPEAGSDGAANAHKDLLGSFGGCRHLCDAVVDLDDRLGELIDVVLEHLHDVKAVDMTHALERSVLTFATPSDDAVGDQNVVDRVHVVDEFVGVTGVAVREEVEVDSLGKLSHRNVPI